MLNTLFHKRQLWEKRDQTPPKIPCLETKHQKSLRGLLDASYQSPHKEIFSKIITYLNWKDQIKLDSVVKL